MIQAVLFDWDGTLVDSKKVILASYRDATEKVLGRAFPDTPEEIALILPMRAQESFPMLAEGQADPAVLTQAYHEAYLVNSERWGGAFTETRSTLDALKGQGLHLGLVTSKSRDRVDSDMDRFEMHDLFSVIVSGDVSAERKPHPGPVLDAVRVLGLDPSSVVMVGDGPQDVIAGRDAGAITVACTYGFHGRSECEEANPDFLIDAIEELLPIVDTLIAER
jgi:HAD superfamily hydrolase (TIGR01509 family)